MQEGNIRIGIFGGSFDPPHIGHFASVRVAAEKLNLHHLLVVPAAVQPNKISGPIADADQRCEMIEAIIKDDPLFRLSKLEIKRGGVSYTVDTLRELTSGKTNLALDLFLLIGSDTLAEIENWKEPETIFSLVRVVVMTRPVTIEKTEVSKWAKQSQVVRVPYLEISSSMIRQRISEGLPVKLYVGKEVAKIIEMRRLYL